MTKEELIEMSMRNPRTPEEREFIEAIQDFLKNNVVIPKGSNPHPDADVLHQWIEGAEVEYFSKNRGGWFKLHNVRYVHSDRKYRIKPSEPAYEWQWEFTYNGLICRTGFYTYEQIKAYMYNIKVTKIEKTKRERRK